MLTIKPLVSENHEWFIQSLQHAFRQVFQDQLAENEEIISRKEIESSMQEENAECLQIELEGHLVAGAVIKINLQTQRNILELFFVCTAEHDKGIGKKAWRGIEQRYPQTKVWETHTPYFEKRNIYFYLKCGFKIVELYYDKHLVTDSQKHEPLLDEMFRFEKEMKE